MTWLLRCHSWPRADTRSLCVQDIVVKLCLEKPANPLKYISEYVGKLSTSVAGADVEEAPAPKRGDGTRRRGAVSADVIDQDDAMAYEKKV